ncbi:iron chelate uptake ABC transporter family permease subunit [Skermania piniformis]|uniref:Iron chelate uptake ABC transporter family permease subunit n=1 Tax=Skermania pinensis TaxID=39122 RepID=A0ABX8SE66_9ACTN|nr:iron chelate uptake ABC transporter family permease subunit [Skermania piniformis]
MEVAAIGPPVPVVTSHRRWLWLGVASAALVLVCVLSLAVGTRGILLREVWDVLTGLTGTDDQLVVRELRIPRTLLGVVAGAALATCGALIQAATRNPLADTQILGINAGAGLAVVIAVAYLGVVDIWSYVWFAFVGAATAIVAVYALGARGRGGPTPLRLTLSGVALGAVMEGISSAIRLSKPRAFDTMRFWDAGTLADRPLTVVLAVAPFVVLGLVLAGSVVGSLNAVALGDDLAHTLGANVARTRAVSMVAVTLLAGAAVAACGPIGFVGLMVPHVVRWFVGPDQRWILGYSLICGPLLVLSADVLGRIVVAPGELPVGIVTAFVGAPMLLWLVARRRVSAL